ncbi:MAG: sigma-70 family RNA polymerase sigma factor [Planctomycetota bacterium]
MRDVTVLVTQAQSGNREALGALVAAVQDDIWRLQLSRTGSEADAEDATQETFARMIASLTELRDPRAFAGWLYRIALNQALMAGRRRAADAKALAAVASTSREQKEEDAMERSELRQAVRRAVEGLEANLRATIELRYEHDLAYADIARAMDCPEGTVADRLHTAHERLKRALAGAGVAITVALLESELSAAPRSAAPPRLAARVAKSAREFQPDRGISPNGPRRKSVAAGLTVALLAALLLTWWMAPVHHKDEESTASGPSNAGNPVAGPTKSPEAGKLASEDSRPTSPTPPRAGKARLTGRVFERDTERPLAGATVCLFSRSSDPNIAPVKAQSDADGRYSLEALPGSWRIDALAAGHVCYAAERWYAVSIANSPPSDEEVVGATRVDLAADQELTRDLPLVPGVRVAGRIVDDMGAAVPGAAVQFMILAESREGRVGFSGNQFRPGVLFSGVDGRFECDGVWPQGSLGFTVLREGYENGRAGFEIGPQPKETTIVLRRLPGAHVWGTVRDERGQALKGAFVYSGKERMFSPLEVPTNELGRFDYADISADRLFLVWSPGYGLAQFSSDVLPPGGADVRLRAADGRVTGVVVDAQGRPVAGAVVQVTHIGIVNDSCRAWLGFVDPTGRTGLKSNYSDACGYLPGDLRAPSATTSEDGRFEFPGVCLGEGCGIELLAKRDGLPDGNLEVLEPGEARIVMVTDRPGEK